MRASPDGATLVGEPVRSRRGGPMSRRLRPLIAGVAGALLAAGLAAPAAAGGTPATGAAPGGPGVDEQYLPATKSGLGTSTSTTSRVWLAVQRTGGLGEVFYPTADSPAARTTQFVVADRRGAAVRAEE